MTALRRGRTGLGDLFAHPFMRTRSSPGTAIAALAGLVGYFVVLRSQVFTGDALSHVAFTGALAALAFGIDAAARPVRRDRRGRASGSGCSATAGRADDVVIGSVFAWVLGLGVLVPVRLHHERAAPANGAAGVNVLFGSIFGLERAAGAAGRGRRRGRARRAGAR